jgi:hypothetical protein
MKLETINFISREQIRTHLLSGTDIYTDNNRWLYAVDRVACYSLDGSLLDYKKVDVAIGMLWLEDCMVDLE